MTVNEAAEGALNSFLNMKNPGYAILVDAPWGAGKTHFVQRVCKTDTRQDVRYVTLNGVSDESGLRRALLKGKFESGLLDKGARFGDVLGKLGKVGNVGSLARDVVEERMLTALPPILIFDDIERAVLAPEVLLGLINDFVEHEGKQVILLVSSEKHENKDKFLEKKEKLIGRTLRIGPDLDAALPHFVATMSEGEGRSYLGDHHDLIRDVFEQAKHGNLRLLRNALRDCALVLDQIEYELFKAQEPMERFVRTYLALAMALGRGDITTDDFSKRDDHNIFRKPEEGSDWHPLKPLIDQHEGADILSSSGATLSTELGKALFVRGYASPEQLNIQLRMTGEFRKTEEDPLWHRLVHWRHTAPANLRKDIPKGEAYLFETDEVIQPGPFLHIADNLLQIKHYAGKDDECETLKGKIVARIKELAQKELVPPADYGLEFRWGFERGTFTYGGYGSEPRNGFQDILEAMRVAQVQRYEQKLPEIIEEITAELEEDIEKAKLAFSYRMNGGGYHSVPILHHLDHERFASAIFGALGKGQFDEAGEFLKRLSERHSSRPRQDWDEERKWAKELRGALEKLAKNAGEIETAQMRVFFGFYWTFSEPVGEVEED